MAKLASDYFQHPIFSPFGFTIKTKQIDDLQKIINRWLWNGATGGYVQGNARIGKTTAVEYLRSRMCMRDGQTLPTRVVSIAKRDTRTIASVFRNLMYALNLQVKSRDNADIMRQNVVQHLLDVAAESDANRALLFVDEMQRLSPFQFNAFAELHDHLRLFGIHLSIIFIANRQESDDLIEWTQREENAHIYGRFFKRAATFDGIQTLEDVQYCLHQYDEIKPDEYEETVTQYFLPKQFESGWRLKELAKPLWTEYKKSTQNHQWGMDNFMSTVNTLLVDYLTEYGVERHISEMVTRSLEANAR